MTIDASQLSAYATVQSPWYPMGGWAVAPYTPAVEWVSARDDGDYIYVPNGSYAVPMTKSLLQERIDRGIADVVAVVRELRRGWRFGRPHGLLMVRCADRNGYDPKDLNQSLQNFLSLGIKVGTDAYKSDTGAFDFKRKADRLRSLFAQAPNLLRVPYAKAAARSLHAGKLDPEDDRRILRDNPTLAGGVMEAGLDLAEQHNLLARASLPGDHPDAAWERTADANARAQALHTQARAQEPAITRTLSGIAENLGTRLRDPDKQLCSIKSLQDQSDVSRVRRCRLTWFQATG
jgi:hypothetical protein